MNDLDMCPCSDNSMPTGTICNERATHWFVFSFAGSFQQNVMGCCDIHTAGLKSKYITYKEISKDEAEVLQVHLL